MTGATQTVPLTTNQVARLDRDRRWRLQGLPYDHSVVESVDLTDERIPVSVVPAAVQDVVARHASLRTTVPGDGQVGLLHDHLPAQVVVLDEAWGPDVEGWLQHDRNQPIDLEHGPLLRAVAVSSEDCTTRLVFTLDHLGSDAGTILILRRDLRAALLHRAAGATHSLWSSPAPGFHEFAAEERAMLANDEGARRLEYWRARLDPLEIIPEVRLPIAATPPLNERHPLRCCLTVGLTGPLFATAKGQGVGPYPVLLAGLLLWLHTATGTAVPSVVAPVASRPPQFRETVGWFSRVLPLRVRLVPSDPAAALIAACADAVSGASDHSLPPARLTAMLDPGRDRRRVWRPRVYVDTFYAAMDPAWKSPERTRARLTGDDLGVQDGLVVIFVCTRDSLELMVQAESGSLNQAQVDGVGQDLADCVQALIQDPRHSVAQLATALAEKKAGHR